MPLGGRYRAALGLLLSVGLPLLWWHRVDGHQIAQSTLPNGGHPGGGALKGYYTI